MNFKINYIIKIFILIIFFNNILCAIEDPVARHDLSECATYLCPTFRNMAEEYLKSGCVGEFKSYFETHYSETHDLELLNMVSNSESSNKENINITTLVFLTTLSSLVSLYVGFIRGKKDKQNELKYLIREMD